MTDKWFGKRVLIIGAARQGQASARFLAKNGALITINDRRAASELESARKALQGFEIRWETGSHPINLLEKTDLCMHLRWYSP